MGSRLNIFSLPDLRLEHARISSKVDWFEGTECGDVFGALEPVGPSLEDAFGVCDVVACAGAVGVADGFAFDVVGECWFDGVLCGV